MEMFIANNSGKRNGKAASDSKYYFYYIESG